MSAAEHLPPNAAQAIAAGLSGNGSAPGGGEPSWEEPIPLDRLGKLPPFPVEVLPGWAGTFVSALATSTATPPDLTGMLVLGVLAACAGGRVWLDVRPDWNEALVLWVVVALPSGENKSAPFRRVTAPLADFEAEQVKAAWPGIIEARARREVADKAAAQAVAIAGNPKNADRAKAEDKAVQLAQEAADLVVPAEPRVLVDDITPERLGSLLDEAGGRLALFSDEGGVFGAMAGRYETKKGAGPTAGQDVWLKAHDAIRLRVDRQGRPPNFVDRPCLTIGIAVQPDVMRGLIAVPGFKGRGVLGRLNYALPTSLLGNRDMTPTPVPPAVNDAYRTEVLALARTLAALPSAGARLSVSEAALAELTAYRRTIEPRLRTNGDLRSMSEWVGKLHGKVARTAALLHLAEHLRDGWDRPVSADTMRRAITVGEYLLPHAQAAHDLMGADDDLDRARFLLGWLAEWGRPTVTRRDVLTHAGRARFPDAATVEATMVKLAEFGWLRHQASQGPGPKGGRPPAPTYELHPRLSTAQPAEPAEPGNGWGSAGSAGCATRKRPDEDPPPTDADLARWDACLEEVDR